MVSPVQQIEALTQRLEKARQLVAEGKVHPVLNLENHFAVESSKGDGMYLVNGHCNCPDAEQRSDLTKGFCKHRLAVEIFKERPQTEEPKPKARKSRTNGAEAKAEAEMHRNGHYVPGDPAPGDDGRSIDEQIADIFPTS